MQHMLPLYIIIITASAGAPRETNSVSKPMEDPCDCPHVCERHESSPYDPVRVYKSSARKDKIFCVSSQPIRWTLGSDFTRVPNVAAGQLLLQSSSQQRNTGHLFCLSLRVALKFPSWQAQTLFAKCETNETGEGTSRWYKLSEKLKFEGQHFNFDPKVTLNPTNMNDKDLKTTEGPFVNNTISVMPFVKITQGSNPADQPPSPKPLIQQSTAHHPPSVPLTIVIASAGGAAVFLVLLLILVVLLLKKVKQQRKEIDMTNEEIDEFMLGMATDKANAKGINGLFILPYDTKLEIPKSEVIFRSKILGSGAFGQVVKGAYQGNQVAIKMLKNNANQNAQYLRSLLGELKVMSYLGSHPNVVGLVGAITRDIKKGEAYLIFEFCSNGNAHKYVRDRRDCFVDMFAAPSSSRISDFKRTSRYLRKSKFNGTLRQSVLLTTKDLVRWSFEVASGMEYVASRNVYHGDLAARNILLAEDLTAKVGDFGLSKQVDMETYNCYVQKKECPLPLKWMAIESLRDLTFSIQSDVWSFGVAMWELFTLGAVPYPGMDWNFESWKLLREGNRLDKPEYASDAIYAIMKSCWNADPKARPSFGQLKDMLNHELRKF